MKVKKVKIRKANTVIDCDWVSVTYHPKLGTVIFVYTEGEPTEVVLLSDADELQFS